MSYSFLKKFFITAAAVAYLSPTAYAMPETLRINFKTSHYMDMHQTVKRIAVGNPTVATVIQLPGSASEFLIVTKEAAGSTSLFVWTIDGVRHEYLIIVSPEDPGQALLIEQAIGLPDVHVKMVGQKILLTGTVENQYEKNYALQTARLFVDGSTESSLLVGSGFDMDLETDSAQNASSGRSGTLEASQSENKGQIIDLLQILHPTQIRLEAQIIEINSDNAKDLGLQYTTTGNPGVFSFGEDYARTNTTITETWSTDGSGSYNSGNSNTFSGNANDSYSGSNNNSYTGNRATSYSGSNGDSYSGSRTDSDGGAYSNNYSDSYSNSYDNTYGNGYNNSSTNNANNTYSGNRNNDYNNSLNQTFSRVITSSWNDMVQFSNNPLKWIGQHFAPVNATLNLLVTQHKARILSRPSVMTLSGEQATIQIGGKIPYEVSTMSSSDVKEIQYGIILQFKPIVDAQNRINSMIHAEVSTLGGQTTSDGRMIILTRSADSVISLNSGSPVVIGGLMDSSETKTVEKIPFLGDIPIIGEFFKHTSKSRDKRELIIVVTPYLVGEDDISRTPVSRPMREWIIQDYDYRQSMENFNLRKPYEEPEVVDETDPDSNRILPPSKINPKTGKIDKSDEPKEDNAIFIAPEEAEEFS